jgi:aldehyde dehydrogenase (NAD+)
MNKDIGKTVEKMRRYFDAGHTLPVASRLAAIRRLEDSIRRHKEDIVSALRLDLNKSPYESFMTEIGVVLGEIDHIKKNLRRWVKPQRKRIAMSQFPARAKVMWEPYGVVLIMSPWNYPFNLSIVPLVGAIAAGNCVALKPSAYAPAVSDVLAAILRDVFPPEFVSVVEGGRAENSALLEQKFDYIFFTGSPAVGKTVMQKAAESLTPVTLELGGKSPVIVERSADIKKTARRILFGKLLNSGQTCIAPDYLLVQDDIKAGLIAEIKTIYADMLPDREYRAKNFPRIINEKHFSRLQQLLEGQKILMGADLYPDNLQMGITLVDEPDLSSLLMQEEIFGPILPVIGFGAISEAIDFIKQRSKPLALYLFTNDAFVEKSVLENLSFGGGCVNDTIMHLSSPHLPFGGVGNSGMGNYHGRASFETFSHAKSILKKSWHFDLALRYHPFKAPEKRLSEWIYRR